MSNIFKKIKKGALVFSGHLYFHNRPMWIVYRPDHDRVTGDDMWKIIECLEPCDMLLRKYDRYLNTLLERALPKIKGGEWGFWGHAGFFAGDHAVLHSVEEGCVRTNILDFIQADAVAVRRVPGLTKEDKDYYIERAWDKVEDKTPYDYDFKRGNIGIYCSEYYDTIFEGRFEEDYEEVGGQMVITPDGLFRSKQAETILTINYNGGLENE